jgi:Mn-dependent DtxR family transcriptional regulator
MLGGFSANRMAMAKDTRDTLEDFTARLKKDVAEIRLDAVNMVHEIADERVARNIELTLMLADFKKQRIPFQEDLSEAHGIWQSHMGNEHPYARPKIKTVHKATKAPRKESAKPKQSTDHGLKEKVLKVINNSPKGITLTKAGKKIGVEWRTLIRPAKDLLKVGDVRKKDTHYFPS